MSVTKHIQPPKETDEDNDVINIRLSDIVGFLISSLRTLLTGALLGGIIGAVWAFSQLNQYTSQITVLPEVQTKSPSNLGNLGSLAGLAGIDIGAIGTGSDAVRPDLYPNVVQSATFGLYLLKQPVSPKGIKAVQPFESFWQQQQTPGLFSWLSFGNSKDQASTTNQTGASELLQMTKEQETTVKMLQEKITAAYDRKTGVLILTSTMPDPLVAAQTANLALRYLTDYVTTYRTEKARLEVDFLARQVAAAKHRYQSAEYELSAYRDRNRSLFLNTAKVEEQRIQAEFLLAQDLYNTLSKQAEMAKIKVQQETPVFKVLEPARVPNTKSGPKRPLILLMGLVLGLVSALAVRFIRFFRAK